MGRARARASEIPMGVGVSGGDVRIRKSGSDSMGFVVLIVGLVCEWHGFLYRSDKLVWKIFDVTVLLVDTFYEKISREYNIILESSVRNLLM